MNFGLVFDAKKSLLDKDPSQLEGLLRDLEPDIHIVNNMDRTLSVNGYTNGIESLDDLISKAIKIWLGDLSFNPILLYSLLSVSDNNYVIKI